VPRWVEEVLDGRPYAGRQALLDRADRAARTLSPEEVASALAGHPRIGEKARAGHNIEASRREQAAIGDDEDLHRRLAEANAAYERRFDQVFLIRAAGLSAQDVLDQITRRLTNDDETEQGEVVDNLRQIALLRLQQVV